MTRIEYVPISLHRIKNQKKIKMLKMTHLGNPIQVTLTCDIDKFMIWCQHSFKPHAEKFIGHYRVNKYI